jgi:arsenite-transporting ATPase
LVTFLGKGGSGKTTAAVLLAKAYASEGKRTVLVVQGQDRVAEALLGHKLPTVPELEAPGSNLTVVRLESTKLLLEPLAQLKKLDARLGFSSGALQEVVGEELSILPSMDTLLAVGALERLAGITGLLNRQPTGSAWDSAGKYDVVVYDGPSNEDVLRLFGSPERARWYLSRFRRLAEKTDAGRVLLPSAARAVDSVLNGGSSSGGESTSTAEVWGAAERVLSGAAEYFENPRKFTAFLVAKQGAKADLATALRLWGCAAQAGIFVGGLLLSPSGKAATPLEEFAPLKSLTLPAAEDMVGEAATGLGRELAEVVSAAASSSPRPKIDQAAGSVALFLPGFDKTEIKLSQYQKGAELLVEAGDQRRSISLPQGMRGKVSGAKFSKGYLTVTLKREAAKA